MNQTNGKLTSLQIVFGTKISKGDVHELIIVYDHTDPA